MTSQVINFPSINELPLPPSMEDLFHIRIPFIICDPVSQNKKLKSHTPGKGQWSIAEDKILLDAMASFNGHICWEELSKRIPGRSAKQCRERWQFRLHPDVNKAPFQPWEDELIIDERVNLGNRWTQIATKLPGRTSCSVKNRWYTVLRNRKSERTPRRTKTIQVHSSPFYYETVMIRDRKELWERNSCKKASNIEV